MHRRSPFLLLLIPFLTACNAPSNAPRSTLAFTEQDLRLTAEAILRATPPATMDLPTSTPSSQGGYAVWPTLIPTASGDNYEYQTLPGDTLAGLSGRFGVEAHTITVSSANALEEYLISGQPLTILRQPGQVSSAQRLLPDSELVYSSSAGDFDVFAFVNEAGGYLSKYHEKVSDEEHESSGADILQRVANELSVNPRLLLAILEYRSGWIYSHPLGAEQERYPIGFRIPDRQGLYEELKIVATQLNLAYYGWRAGSFTELRFEDSATLRLDPTLNAGSVALMHLFALDSKSPDWEQDLYSPYGFPVKTFNLFGDAWARDRAHGPLIPADLEQPDLELPFLPREGWSLTAGPHNAWNAGTPLGALDLSPITAEEPCGPSATWVTASAPGVVVRARDHVVALDLDGDDDEGSGWVIVYYHIAEQDMIPEGLSLGVDQRLGHPSCEGGIASGTHVHLARKYNGEWMAADGPVPFLLSGWRAVAGERIYAGQLVKGDQTVTADPAGRAGSTILR